MINIAIIGYGYWGPNLTRNFNSNSGCRVKYVVDSSEARLKAAKSLYPDIIPVKNFDDILGDDSLDAVAIATPVTSHFALAMKALQVGKHALVEKPMTDTSESCRQLMAEAEKRNLILMVDHPFLFSGPVRKIKNLIDREEIGDIYYCDSTRINLGLFSHDVSVIWDLAVHDLSIIDYWIPEKPVAVTATAKSHIAAQPENIAYINLHYPSNCICHIHVNWLAPVKVRQTLLCGSKKMLVYNDLSPDEKVKIYDKGVSLEQDSGNIREMLVGYRSGDVIIPQIKTEEPLREMTGHFVDCINRGEAPLTDAASALRTIRILEATSESMRNNGKLINL